MPQGYETITVEDADDIKDITGENGMLSAYRTLCKLHLNRFFIVQFHQYVSHSIAFVFRPHLQGFYRPGRQPNQPAATGNGH